MFLRGGPATERNGGPGMSGRPPELCAARAGLALGLGHWRLEIEQSGRGTSDGRREEMGGLPLIAAGCDLSRRRECALAGSA